MDRIISIVGLVVILLSVPLVIVILWVGKQQETHEGTHVIKTEDEICADANSDLRKHLGK